MNATFVIEVTRLARIEKNTSAIRVTGQPVEKSERDSYDTETSLVIPREAFDSVILPGDRITITVTRS